MEIGDEDIFNAAMSDKPEVEAPAPEPNPEPEPEAPAEEQGQPRDEHGKFASKQAVEPPAETPEPPAEAQAQPEPRREDHRIPLTEHLAEREKRQAAERERDQERQRIAALERQIAELSRPKAQPAEEVDPWSDLPGAIGKVEKTVQEQLAEMRLQTSIDFARFKHGELFDTALREAQAAAERDPTLNQRIFASPNVGEAIVLWHKEQTALKEIGGDVTAYKQRVIDEALKDPEVIKRVIEGARASAQQPTNGQPRSPNVNLPPSLNRTTGSGGQALTPVARTDAEMFQELFPQ